MCPKKFVFLIFFVALFIGSCSETSTDSDPASDTGTLIVDAVKTIPGQSSPSVKNIPLKETSAGTYVMNTIDLKLTVTEVWVSTGVVSAGNPDNLSWHKIGENSQLKFFDEYTFTSTDIPAGDYKSIKMIFKNIFYRVACYDSDHSNVINMKERMGDWVGDCSDENALAPTNYFSADGNHQLIDGVFVLVAPGEKVSGFEIQADVVTRLYWKLGDERSFDPYVCTFEWIDENDNGVWDCGIDRQDNYNCTVDPPLEVMWSFIVQND